MRVLLTGASGAIGTRLVPQLIDRGHDVTGTSTSTGSAERVRALGAEAIVLDLLDPRAVREAVREAQPDAIVHQATALANVRFTRKLDKSFVMTNRLRTEGTDALLDAAREAGVSRFVAQSFAGMRYERTGGPVKTEDDPLDPAPLEGMREVAAAMVHLERAVTAAGGIVLRYGGFYGADNDGLVEPVRRRQFPIVGDGGGVMSFVHLEDAAAATVLALEHDASGDLQHRRQRARPRTGMAAGACTRARREAAAPGAGLAREAARRRDSRHARDRGTRGVEREGQARARLDAPLPDLAARLRRGLRESAGVPGPLGPDAGEKLERRCPMRVFSAFVAVASLLVTVALLPLPGGVLFAMFSFGLFLLALGGVFAGLENRTVRQHDASTDPRGWRDGS